MKIQDIFFILLTGICFYKRDPKLAVLFGIFSLIFSIPLFSLWIFFTAERLTWYAAAFFLLAILFYSIQRSHSES
ncbi:MAG: hypothetical protein HYV37_02550 [Candidatus Levyibacteriota bacterium]|nr:MAG: hypothetical protein HYV37_02550 [Candidatus Levybacteria bacterium]